jgi:site-specific DNA recombinase
VWNTTTWQKDPDTGKRRIVKRPETEWVRHMIPELRVIDEGLSARVQARHEAAARAGANIREGIRRAGHKAGCNPVYLFSSLLRCGMCGGPMVITGGQGKWKSYGCATRKEGGPHACSNGLTAKLPVVEARLLQRIKEDLFTDDVAAEIERRYARALARQPKPVTNGKRIAELRAEIENLTDAIASGALRSSKALAARLAAAEGELERLMAHQQSASGRVVKMPAQIVERFRRMVANLEAWLTRDVHKARTALRQIVGDETPVVPHESGKHLVARLGLETQALVAAGGSQIFMVAGAGFCWCLPATEYL